ncbi:MAG: MFS transporter [Thermoprotei archaeon]
MKRNNENMHVNINSKKDSTNRNIPMMIKFNIELGKLFQGLNKNVIILILFLLILYFSSAFINLIYQLYFKSVGYSAFSIGILSTVMGLTVSVLLIPSGILADIFNRKIVITIGSFILCTGQVLIFVYMNYTIQLMAMFLIGLGSAFIVSAGGAFMTEILDEKFYDKGFSFLSSAQVLATTIAGIVGWLPVYFNKNLHYSEVDSYKISGLIMGIIGFTSLLFLFLIKEIKKTNPKSRLSLNLFKDDKNFIMKFAFINVIVGLGAGFSIPLFNYYLSVKFNVDSGPIGTLNAFASFTMIPLYIMMPHIRESFGYLRAIVLPQAFSIILLMLIPVSPNFIVASLFYISRQALMNIPNPLVSSFMMRNISQKSRATANAIINMSWSLPNSISIPLGGYIMDRYLDLPIYITSVFYMIYVILLNYFIKRYDQKI